MYIVCINGASASGKSNLAHLTEQAFLEKNISCQKISMDNYYHERPKYKKAKFFRATTNFDTPAMLRLDLLKENLLRLHHGKAITNRVFDFSSNRYSATEITHQPSEIVIIEGLFAALFAKSLPVELAHYKVHVQTNDYLNLLHRRSVRDTQERGRANKAEVLNYERKHVGAGFLQYTAKNATGSDLYVENNALPKGSSENFILKEAAQTIVEAFQTQAIPTTTGHLAKTLQQRVIESHHVAATMTDRAPCFEGPLQKSFSGVFGEPKSHYPATEMESCTIKRKLELSTVNNNEAVESLRRSRRL